MLLKMFKKTNVNGDCFQEEELIGASGSINIKIEPLGLLESSMCKDGAQGSKNRRIKQITINEMVKERSVVYGHLSYDLS